MPAAAQKYPSRPIKLIVPFPPGGGNDLIARPLAAQAEQQVGQAIVIDNRGGANGIIGTQAVANAEPDGYTLLHVSSSFSINNAVYKKLPYDIFKDFAPISLIADYPLIVLVNKSHPAQNVGELVTWLKANPDKANYPTPSPIFTLPIEHFKIKSGAPGTAISYRSGNESLTSLLGGQTAFGFVEAPVAVPQLGPSSNLRALAVTSTARNPELPDVPTLAEAGVPEVLGGSWVGLLAPAGTPAPIIKKIEAACRQIAATDDFKARMRRFAAAPVGSTGEELMAQMKAEVQRYSGIVKAANLKFE
jgi:tripartite-type tricarboxylate transporter receptor subunit TctC